MRSPLKWMKKAGGLKSVPSCTPGWACAGQPPFQPSWGPAEPSWHELCPVLSHSLFPVGVGLAGAQAKHLRLISGTNGAWAVPVPSSAGREKRWARSQGSQARSGVWVRVSHTLPLSGERFRAFVGSPGERAAHTSFDYKGRCLTNTTGAVTFLSCCHFSDCAGVLWEWPGGGGAGL